MKLQKKTLFTGTGDWELLFEPVSDLAGVEVRVGGRPSWSHLHLPKDGAPISGTCVEYLNALAGKFGFTYVIENLLYYKKRYPDGSIKGIIPAVGNDAVFLLVEKGMNEQIVKSVLIFSSFLIL